MEPENHPIEKENHLSHQKNPGGLGYIGDYRIPN